MKALRQHSSVSDYTFAVGLPHVEMKAEGQEVVDDLLKNTSRSDLFSSFKAETNTFQWLHWLDILDQQTSNQSFGGSDLDSDLDFKGNTQLESLSSESKTGKSSATKDSLDSSVKSGNMFGRGLQTSGDKYPTLKFPEAMVAIAQAAKGWPLMSNKMQMHKCEKCSQEFCCPLNQRRHMRAIHRRPLNGDKEDLKKKREQIAAFWDKLNSEDASEIVSAKNLSLMDLSATSVVRALTTQLQQPSLLLLPQTYIKVATALLDLVQNKNSKVPIKSGELFAILEDASEKNMLCGVTSSSMHRCIFDNDPGRVGLEIKNLAASLGFLVEYRLVRAWMDDKDAEALRCQKALVEEEEAAQKRRAKILERKKQRKLRIKEFKDKERRSIESSACLQELKFEVSPREGEDSLTATQSSPSSSVSSGVDSHSMETPQMATVDSQDPQFSTDCFEVGQSYEERVDEEESRSGCSNHVNELPNESVEERDGGPSTGFSANGAGWKERRQVDCSYYPNNGRQLYGKDRKHYDHHYGGQRSARTSYGVPAFEYFAPRYGHYREKLPALKKPSAVAGTGHAVWARKTPQTQSATFQHNENGEINVSGGRDDYTGGLVEPAERFGNEDQPCSVKLEKGLSRASSLSSDSATSQSSVSISAKVGAEEQDTLESKTVPVSFPPQITSMGGDFRGSAALVIGSVSIPLEHPLPGSRTDGPSKESGSTSAAIFEGKSALPDGPYSNPVAHDEVERACRLSSTSSLEEFLTPRGGVSHQTGVREDTNVLSRSAGSSVQNKAVVKVWRPVTPGERTGPQTACPSFAEVGKSDALDISAQHRQEIGANCGSDSPIQSLYGSGGDVEAWNREQVVHEAAFQRTASSLSAEEGQEPPDSSSLTTYYSELASFLAQRWSKAMSSPDIVCHHELDDLESGESV